MRQNFLSHSPAIIRSLLFVITLYLFVGIALSQTDATNIRFTQGQVNEGATASLEIPLATFPGRGLDLPVGLTYSSTVWRIDHMRSVNNYNVAPPYYVKQSVTQALFAEHSKAGWKSNLDLPAIEWPKDDEVYDYHGTPANPGWKYRVARVTIHMPDGSSHEFRKSDRFYIGTQVDTIGTFYAVDGSRMRFDSTGVDTGTLYMPDGTRYVLDHPYSYLIDRFGNRQTYNEATRQWTDLLGRVISNPIPANPQAQDYNYSIPGLNGMIRTYVFRWRNLADALAPNPGGGIPSLRIAASHYLPNPWNPPSDSNGPNFPQPQSSNRSLFQSAIVPPEDETNPPPTPIPVLVVGGAQAGGQLFNPVVLAEIVLPDGSSYKFTYNAYGELSKIVYPTGAYEQYEYDPMISYLDQQKQPYVQATRKISSRKLSTDGSGNDITEWRYSQIYSDSTFRVTQIVAPDNTRSDFYKWELPEPLDTRGKRYWPFGQSPSLNGKVFETRQYATSPTGFTGELLRRELTEYEESIFTYTYTAPGINPPFTKTVSAYRNARPKKMVSLIFEGSGPALASVNTYDYDSTFEFSTGVDQVRSNTYHYSVVDNTPIYQNGGTLANNGQIAEIPIGALARYTETSYSNNPVYRDQNILGVTRVSTVRDPSGNTVSQSEIVYDECPQYCVEVGRALPTSLRTWDSTKGSPSNISAYLVTHSRFDQFGNRIESIDAKGSVTTTVYDSSFYVYPVQVITPAPDPTGVHGSSSTFTSTSVYDVVSGLLLSTTDANGLETRFEYNDPLLRPTRTGMFSSNQPVGSMTETYYGAGTDEATRWVKVRAQIDVEKWSEAISRYDGLGRTYLSQKVDSNGDVFTETEYDLRGRVKRSTNPFRSGETKQWTTPEYDDLGRTKKVISPDTDDVRMIYGLSINGLIGTTKTIIDQTGRERTGVTDALGNVVRVYEGPVTQNVFTDYLFDTAGNLRKTIQGEQSRYFGYDSLGRVLFSKQPEQDTNPAIVGTDPVTNNSAWSAKYTYDDNGNIRTSVDARNISVTGTYDALNRLVARDYSDSTSDVEMFYDGTGLATIPGFAKGKITKVTSNVSETRNTSFDSMGRLLESEQRTTPEQRSGTQAPYGFKYVYNLSGSLIEETYPSGRVVRSTVDNDGELSQVQSRKNSTHGFFTYADSFDYSASGALLKMQLGNGHWATAEYDPKRLQITKIGLGLTPGDQNIFKLEFQYTSDGQIDNNGSMRLQRITVPASGASPGFTATQSYFYDSINRLSSGVETVAGQQTWKQTFTYDRYGNRRFDPANTTTLAGCQPSVCNPGISTATNRLLSSDGYVFDASGSLTRDAGGTRYGYDAEGRQKEFFASTNQTSAPDATYYYDGDGKRVKKIVGSEVTIFVYDATGQLAAEYSTNVVPTSQAKVSYLTTDHLGSVRVTTDQYGRVSSRKDFTSFGEEIVTPHRTGGPTGNGYDPPNVRQDYTGYEKDSESGLEFAQARYYNPRHGRFTSVDPLTASATLKNPQTLNRYSYALNSPYKFTDPLGLMYGIPGGVGGQRDMEKALQERMLERFGDAGYDVEWFLRNQPRAKQVDRSKKKKKSPAKTKSALPIASGGLSAMVDDGVSQEVGPTVGISSERERMLTVGLARILNNGHTEEQAILEKAAANTTSESMKAAIKDVADSFDPNISVSAGMSGPSGGVTINIPSPGRILESILVSGIDTKHQVVANRIDTVKRVNNLLLDAHVDYQSRNVEPAEITRSLLVATQNAIRMHKAAVLSIRH